MWLPSLLADMKFPPPIIPHQNSSSELDSIFLVPTIVCETSCIINTLVFGRILILIWLTLLVCGHVSDELLPELWVLRKSLS